MNGELQRSRFNYFTKRGDDWVAFNARTGVFAQLSSETGELLRSTSDIADACETQDLVDMGFLHRGDEVEAVTNTYLGGRTFKGNLNVTIAPSLACNKTCPYCYQNEYRTDRKMSPATQDATVQYIRARVKAGWKKVSVTWYGGEPLLAIDIVISLSERLRQAIGEAGGALGDMGIITNGTLLDEDAVARLMKAGVAWAQMSFDTLTETGAETRGLIDADGNPSVILRNTAHAATQMGVSIRINVNRANADDVPRMLSVLREHGLDGLAYLARTEDLDGEAGYITEPSGRRSKPEQANGGPGLGASAVPVRPDPDTLRRAEFARFEQGMFDHLPSTMQSLIRKLTPKTHFCAATQGSMFVVDPVGNISRCWDSVGVAAESMGNVRQQDSDMSDSDVAGKWAAMSPFLYPACTSCRVLPLCMGGCTHPRVFMKDKRSPCESIKFQIDTAVEKVAQIIKLPGFEEARGTES